MNPYVIIGIMIALIADAAVCYHKGGVDKQNEIEASQAKVEKAIQDTQEKARLGTAEAIAAIHVNQVTIQGKVEHEIETHTVYRDCVHTPDSLRLINDALENHPDAGSFVGPELPNADTSGGPVIRGHDAKAPGGG
jgi:hypothetical protein